jgi:hypothetical protein
VTVIRPPVVAWWLLPTLLAAGCSSGSVVVSKPLEPVHERLVQIGAAYTRYNTQYERPPTQADQLTPFLKEYGDPDQILRSPRDNEPFVVCWGLDVLTPKMTKAVPVLAYERQGAGGRRYVLTTLRSVYPMTDEEFRQASFPPGHRPPP